jgi:hypothetical protein
MGVKLVSLYSTVFHSKTRPAWAGFKTAEEGRAKNLLIFMVKVKE